MTETATVTRPSARDIISQAMATACRPRIRMTVSEWANAHRVLSSKGAAETGQWRTSRTPYLREIMDSLSYHSSVSEITVMKASQIGLTEGPFISSIGYYISQFPCPVMVLMPTLEARDSWRVQKLSPLLTDTACIRDILGGNRRRDASNAKDMIDFPGGVLFLAGGNSPNSYAQKSVRVIEMDDLDRFRAEVGEEGDPVELARTRVKAFIRHKILKGSTPTIRGASLIEREFNAGDRRHYHVRCPHCLKFQVLKWSNVFANAGLTEAWYACEHCGCEIDEHHKTEMLKERGHGGTAKWVPDRPEVKDHRSYQISSIYAPIGLGPSWLDLVRQFRRVYKDVILLKVFINSQLGETWEDRTSDLKTDDLERRARDEAYEMGTVPPGCLVFTIGVDTQDDWLEYTRLGWGADGKLWPFDHGQVVGDTTSDRVWDELEAEIHTPVINAFGKKMLPLGVAVDSRGHRTEQVKNFVMRKTLRVRVYSIQGSTTRMGRAIAQSGSYPNKNARGKVVRHGYCVWNVGTEYCKDFIYGHLYHDGNRQREDRIFHFPAEMPEEYYDGILSETYDPEKKRYMQRLGAKYKRNEPLDTLVYAWAIGNHRNLNIGRNRRGDLSDRYWHRLKVMLEPEDADPGSELEPEDAPTSDDVDENKPRRKPRRAGKKRGGFVKNW